MIYTFLIGSGFSVPAGLPTGKELNKRIRNARELPIAFHTSGCIVTNIDGTKPDFGFPTLHDESFEFCMKLIDYYSKSHEFDYEEFYDYFVDLNRKASLQKQGKHLQKLYAFLPDSGYYLINREKDKQGLHLYIQTGRLNHIYQELVNFLLLLPKSVDYSSYRGWCEYVKGLIEQGDVVNIYSLNHDTLIEELMGENGMDRDFCDGFAADASPYYGNVNGKDMALEFFANQYDKPIRLHKLHGSVSYYLFNKEVGPSQLKASNIVKRPSGLEDYDVFYADGNNRTSLTRGMLGMEADFLTGAVSKIRRYESPIYYKPQFDNFERDLQSTNQLIVIGYGFKDARVNEIIKNTIGDSTRSTIIDPYISSTAKIAAINIFKKPEFIKQTISESFTSEF